VNREFGILLVSKQIVTIILFLQPVFCSK